jgi:hypothetical protein
MARAVYAVEVPPERQEVPYSTSSPDQVFSSQSPELIETPEAWSIDGQTPHIEQFGVGYRFGDGLGFKNGFADIEWSIPLYVDIPFDNFFVDAHFLAKDESKIAGNVTLDYRRYNLDWNRIFGVYAFWDGMESPLGRERNQVGVGFETMGQILDARMNVYIPDAFDVRSPLPDIFQGNQLIVNRAEVAMTGGDGELGVNLPVIRNVRSRVFGGGYYYDGHGTQNTSGWKARAEAELNRNVWVDCSVQDDELFGFTCNVGIVIRYAHRFWVEDQPLYPKMDHKYFRGEAYNANSVLSDRLSDPIRRNQNVVLVRDDGVAATDTSGNVLNFIHVANGSAGTGTFENPYGTISAAMADANAGSSIVYTPFGGNFVENVNLTAGTKLLSNGPVQSVTTQFGVDTLPFSGQHTDLNSLPTLIGNVTLASNTQFSGFEVSGGVSSAAATAFTVENSVITNAAGDALSIAGAGTSTLTNLTLTSGAGRGLFLFNSAANVNDLHVVNAATNGVEVTTGAATRRVTINNLTVDAAGQHGVDLNLGGAGSMNYIQSGTINVQSTGNAFDAALQAGSTGFLNLNLGTVNLASTAGAGVNLDGTAGTGTINLVSIEGNITQAATGGFLANKITFDGNLMTAGNQEVMTSELTIGSSTDSTQVKGDGLRLLDPTGTWTIDSLNVFNDTGTGVLVNTKGGGTTFTLNTTDGNILTTNGTALNLDPLTVGMSLATVRSDTAPTNGIKLDTVRGALTIDTTILNDGVGIPIVIQNTPAELTANFGNTTIKSTISDQKDDNIDTATNNGTNLEIIFTSLSITGP